MNRQEVRRSDIRWRRHARASVFTGVGILIFVLPGGHAPAQEPSSDFIAEPAPNDVELEDIDLLDLDVPPVPMVVTAGRRAQRITTVPYAVGVITAEDIRRAGARSVPDAMRLVPGVDVADLGYGRSAVCPRGDNGYLSNKVLVLMDGRQIFDSVFGGTIWGNWPFQLEDIDRIEVIRGPGGVTWGNNAVNGVINIITKDPKDQSGLTFTGLGGSHGTHKEHLGYAFGDERFRLRVSGEYESTDGFHAADPPPFRLSDDTQYARMSVHAMYVPTERDTFTFSGGHALTADDRIIGAFARAGSAPSPGSQASYLLGTWSHARGPHESFEITGYVNDFHGDLGAAAIDYRYQQLALLASHQFALGDEHTITWGLDTRTDLIDATNADPFLLTRSFVSTAIIGLYAQDDWRFAPQWVFSLGGRMDYEFYGGFEPSARASLAYELNEESVLYGAVSRAFAMPSGGIRFLNIPVGGGLARLTSDQNTRAQTLLAYEVGYRTKLFDRLDASMSLYWHEYENLTAIHPGVGPPALVRMHYDNWGTASNYGVELDARYAVTDALTLLAHYTHQQYDWRSSVPHHERDVVKPPKHKFMLGARYDATEDLHLSSHLYWVDACSSPDPMIPIIARSIDPYFRLDLRAEYEFWKDQASVAVGVRNLLDAGHTEGMTTFLSAAEVPRMIYAELRLHFD